MAESKTKTLFLKIKQDSGMKFSPVDPLTNRVNKKSVVLLFPDEPIEVETKLADLLLKQNQHLISEEPYKPEGDVRLQTVKEAEKARATYQAKRMMETTEERAKANARFIKSADNSNARQFQKVRPSHDPGLLYGGDRNAVDDKGESLNKDDVMKYVEPLSEFSEIDRETVKRERLRYFAQVFGASLGRASSVSAILTILDKKAAELTKKIEAVMKRTDKAYIAAAGKISKTESEIPKPSRTSGLLPVTGPDSATEISMQEEALTIQALNEQGDNAKK
jgi:hypothetical protein